MRHLINKVTESITDDWFKTGAFKCAKDSTAREKFEIATEPGTLHHLEGNGEPQHYQAGWYIITGPKGEKYSQPPETFRELKKDNGDGTATPRAIPKLAKIADHKGIVNTSWGEPLHYNPGEDIIVRHGPNDYGVVKKDIFAQTYKRL
jgi:hypothetical protein